MPQTSQGDIFQSTSRTQLAIVFGHIGFNEMQQQWVAFAKNQPTLSGVRDPFTDLIGHAVEWAPQKWLWFVPEKENHGMTERQLEDTLNAVLAWASQNSIRSVVTNGIANIDHGINNTDNRCSDDLRAAWLKDYASKAESEYKLSIELISLNDVFVR